MAEISKRFLIASGRKLPKFYLETGTYTGANLKNVIKNMDYEKIVSIELSSVFCENNRKIFQSDLRVLIVEGDSSIKIREVWAELGTPKTIFLDAHYSGPGTAHGKLETPLLQELDSIKDLGLDDDSIIVIDDIRQLGKAGLLKGDGIDYLAFQSDWTEVTLEEIISRLPQSFRTMDNRNGWITNGKRDQLVCFKTSEFHLRIILIIDQIYSIIRILRLILKKALIPKINSKSKP